LIFTGQELVGNYNANFYSINGMILETRKRREHLTKEDLQKNKALLENFATGNTQYLEEQNGKSLVIHSVLAIQFIIMFFTYICLAC
jgi:hypothetical protein